MPRNPFPSGQSRPIPALQVPRLQPQYSPDRVIAGPYESLGARLKQLRGLVMKQYGEQVSWEAGQQASRDVQAIDMNQAMGLGRDKAGNLKQVGDPADTLAEFFPQSAPITAVAQTYYQVAQRDMSKRLLTFGQNQLAVAKSRHRNNPAGYIQEGGAVVEGILDQVRESAPHLVPDLQFQLQQVYNATSANMTNSYLEKHGAAALNRIGGPGDDRMIQAMTRHAVQLVKEPQPVPEGSTATPTYQWRMKWSPATIENAQEMYHLQVREALQLLPPNIPVDIGGSGPLYADTTAKGYVGGTASAEAVTKKIEALKRQYHLAFADQLVTAYDIAVEAGDAESLAQTDFLAQMLDGTFMMPRLGYPRTSIRIPGQPEAAAGGPDLVPIAKIYGNVEDRKTFADTIEGFRTTRRANVKRLRATQVLQADLQYEATYSTFVQDLLDADGDTTKIAAAREAFIKANPRNDKAAATAQTVSQNFLKWEETPTTQEERKRLLTELEYGRLRFHHLTRSFEDGLLSPKDFQGLKDELHQWTYGTGHFSKTPDFQSAHQRLTKAVSAGDLLLRYQASDADDIESNARLAASSLLYDTVRAIKGWKATDGYAFMPDDMSPLVLVDILQGFIQDTIMEEIDLKTNNPYTKALNALEKGQPNQSKRLQLLDQETQWNKQQTKLWNRAQSGDLLLYRDDAGTFQRVTLDVVLKAVREKLPKPPGLGDARLERAPQSPWMTETQQTIDKLRMMPGPRID